MNLSADRKYFWLEQGALHYVLICLIALAVMYLDLGQRDLVGWAFVPAAVGLAGLATRWGAGSVLVIVAIALVLSLEENAAARFSLGSSLLVPDLILAASLLAYVMAHSRFTLINQAFSAAGPPRKKKSWRKSAATAAPAAAPVPAPAALRSQRLVSPQEVGRILLAVPLWAIAGECCWLLLPAAWGNPAMHPNYWRLLLLVWLVGGSLLFLGTVLGYVRLLRQTPAEAVLCLQDVLWRETRWEQRRINRWFAWAHVRSRRPARTFRLPLRWVVPVLTVALFAIIFIVRVMR